MADPLESLWPEDVGVEDVLTPLRILRFQAHELLQRTQGRLKAEIETVVDRDETTHTFDLIAPLLSHYRYRLFRVVHFTDRVYPASVYSSELKWDDGANENREIAQSQSDLADLIGIVLQSGSTLSVVQSLLARINEL